MKRVYAPRALRDVDEILTYVQARSLKGAATLSVAIEKAADSCALNPFLGIATDTTGTFRYPLTRYDYTIFYRVRADLDEVEIVRVIHAARIKDLGRLPDDD